MKEPIRMPPGRSMRRPAKMRIARRKSSVSEDVTMAKGNNLIKEIRKSLASNQSMDEESIKGHTKVSQYRAGSER